MADIRTRIFLAIVVLFIVFVSLTREQAQQPFVESRILMDTLITIRAYSDKAAKAVDLGFAAFAEVEKLASFHLPDSELARLNQRGDLAVESSLTPLLKLSADYYALSEGYFDPSFACLQKAYGFYSGVGRLPEQVELNELLQNFCGLDKILRQNGDGFVLASGSLLDLGGIAGGYAIGKAAQALKEAGCTAFLIDDAGDIWFEGQKPDNTPWRIAVLDPRDKTNLALIESRSPLAISTSGDYERFITVAGVRYGHIMNPHSGRPVDYYSSVTLIASEPIAADALSTAVFAMPPEIAFKWVEERNLPVLFLTATGTIHLSSAGRHYFSQVKTE
ncbi:MAG: FAD:protein FMN transferase [Candidatus Riflebacteria bacterium]|nr:FAD:protein FMN transferase [Candidatus Riflebacteria bacterium]